MNYLTKTFIIFILSLITVYVGSITSHYLEDIKPHYLINKIQTSSLIRPKYNPGFNHLIQMKLTVKDDTAAENGKIAEVMFDDTKIKLQPAGPSGKRGVTHFQVFPGKHTIFWKVFNHKYSWPRVTPHSKTINVSSDEVWIDILIEGDRIHVK